MMLKIVTPGLGEKTSLSDFFKGNNNIMLISHLQHFHVYKTNKTKCRITGYNNQNVTTLNGFACSEKWSNNVKLSLFTDYNHTPLTSTLPAMKSAENCLS